MSSAVVLNIDGLGAKYLGPFGNTWIETPAFNQLATESYLLDNVYASFSNSWKTLEAQLQGKDAMGNQLKSLCGSDLLQVLDANGVRTNLLTDDADFVDQPITAGFAEQLEIEPTNRLGLAEEWDTTSTATFFAHAVRAIEELDDNSLLWLSTKGFGNPWDAPYEYRNRFADEEDPEPTGSSQVPSLRLDTNYDPDTLHEIQCAFAGQVSLLDQCFAVFLSVINDIAKHSETLFVCTSSRGFPLGEHLRVGWQEPALYHELLYVPAFLRYPDGQRSMQRDNRLLGPSDITCFLLDWFDIENNDGQTSKNFSLSRGQTEWSLRTPCWQFRFQESEDKDENLTELYLKPDDQNEVNDVADRCGDVVDAGAEFLKSLKNNKNASPPDILLEPRQ